MSNPLWGFWHYVKSTLKILKLFQIFVGQFWTLIFLSRFCHVCILKVFRDFWLRRFWPSFGQVWHLENFRRFFAQFWHLENIWRFWVNLTFYQIFVCQFFSWDLEYSCGSCILGLRIFSLVLHPGTFREYFRRFDILSNSDT